MLRLFSGVIASLKGDRVCDVVFSNHGRKRQDVAATKHEQLGRT